LILLVLTFAPRISGSPVTSTAGASRSAVAKANASANERKTVIPLIVSCQDGQVQIDSDDSDFAV
jgi:hypothetical protein